MIALSRLEGFYWVARTGGYAKAARAFPWPISQPGVHQQVRRLEEELSTRLFERTGRDSVALTPAGKVLFSLVAPFYEQLPALEATLKRGAVGGTLRIHAAGHVLRHLMPAWLRALQRERPDIDVRLHEAHVAEVELLRRNETDLLVDWLPEVPDDLEARPVAKVRAFVVVPSSQSVTRLAQLKDLPFVAYGQDRALRALQEQALAEHGLNARVTHTADSSDTILGFVAAGLGFSLVPSLSESGPHVAGVTAFPLQRPASTASIYALWRKRSLPNPLVDAALTHAPKP